MRISVERRHITEGEPGSPLGCAVALALNESPRESGMQYIVGRLDLQEYNPGTGRISAQWHWSSPSVRAYLRDFDARVPIQPAIIELRNGEWSIARSGPAQVPGSGRRNSRS